MSLPEHLYVYLIHYLYQVIFEFSEMVCDRVEYP